MGRNAAFGRPPASERFLTWWGARSKIARQNTYLALLVGALSVAIVMAATARDQAPGTRRVIASRPQPTTTLALPTPSTVNIGALGAAAGSATATDLFGLNTTTTTPAPAPTAPPATRPAPTVATTAAPAPATTVTNPDIIFTTVAPDHDHHPAAGEHHPAAHDDDNGPDRRPRRLLSVPLSVPTLLAPG